MARFQDDLDSDAFDRLVSRYLSPALAVAGRMVNDSALAEDAVQEAFLKVIRGRKKYSPGMSFSGWFYTILRNVCRDMLRSLKRQGRLIREAAENRVLVPEPEQAPSVDKHQLMEGLDEDDRLLLTLRIIEELPFREIAAALDITEEAARKRAQRALRRVKDRMNEKLPENSVPESSRQT